MFSFESTGTRDLTGALQALADDAPAAIGAELYREAEAVIAESAENFVPVDQGALRASKFVEQPEISGNDISVRLGFGGPAVDYAYVQHENESFQHTVGESHYLIKPLNQAVPGMAARIAFGLWQRLRGVLR